LLKCTAKYFAHVEDGKGNKSLTVTGQKRKSVRDYPEEVNKKREALEADLEVLSSAANDYARQAETLHQIYPNIQIK
jgi:hypothetical protein